jgi:hypothetical protein
MSSNPGNVTLSIISFQFTCNSKCSNELKNMSSLNNRYSTSYSWTFELNQTINLFYVDNSKQIIEKGSMILYEMNENDLGRIKIGSMSIGDNSDYSWNKENLLEPINGKFCVKVNAKKISNSFSKTTNKIYTFPGSYILTAYFDNFKDNYFNRTITVYDGMSKIDIPFSYILFLS